MKITKLTLLLFLIITTSHQSFSQENQQDEYQEINPYGENQGSFSLVERWPMYPNGIEGVNQDIANNLIYPEIAQSENIEGKVIVGFVVQTDGSVGEIKIVDSAHEILNEEALRVVGTLQQWKPAIQKGKPVKTAYQHVIDFSL